MSKKQNRKSYFDKSDRLAVLGIAFIMLFQFGSYFISKLFIENPHIVNQEIDSHIPFIKYFVVFYCVWYVMILVIPFIISRRDRDLFRIYIITYALMYFAALITFIVYPTIVEIPPLQTTDFFSGWMNLIYEKDYPPINCIPSGHTMSSVVMIYGAVLCKKLKPSAKATIVIISLLTICSTVFTKQHALIDLFFGFAYATIIFAVVLVAYRYFKRK